MGGGGSGTDPHKITKLLGSLSSPDSLENNKATKPAFIAVGPSSVHQRNAI